MIHWDPKLLGMYRDWHWDQIRTQDLDPVYPWLRAYRVIAALDERQAASLTLCYLTWYDVSSAVQACLGSDKNLPVIAPALPTGVERRAHRSTVRLQQHLDSLNKAVGNDPWGWLTDAGSWEAMTQRVMMVHGNGRWAAYKACDLAVHVHDASWVAPDAGHAHSTGPRKALAILGVEDPGDNSPGTIRFLDAATLELAGLVGDSDLSRIETSLCDFRSHLNNRHPLGHDLEILRKQAARVPLGLDAFEAAGLRCVS